MDGPASGPGAAMQLAGSLGTSAGPGVGTDRPWPGEGASARGSASNRAPYLLGEGRFPVRSSAGSASGCLWGDLCLVRRGPDVPAVGRGAGRAVPPSPLFPRPSSGWAGATAGAEGTGQQLGASGQGPAETASCLSRCWSPQPAPQLCCPGFCCSPGSSLDLVRLHFRPQPQAWQGRQSGYGSPPLQPPTRPQDHGRKARLWGQPSRWPAMTEVAGLGLVAGPGRAQFRCSQLWCQVGVVWGRDPSG